MKFNQTFTPYAVRLIILTVLHHLLTTQFDSNSARSCYTLVRHYTNGLLQFLTNLPLLTILPKILFTSSDHSPFLRDMYRNDKESLSTFAGYVS